MATVAPKNNGIVSFRLLGGAKRKKSIKAVMTYDSALIGAVKILEKSLFVSQQVIIKIVAETINGIGANGNWPIKLSKSA